MEKTDLCKLISIQGPAVCVVAVGGNAYPLVGGRAGNMDNNYRVVKVPVVISKLNHIPRLY